MRWDSWELSSPDAGGSTAWDSFKMRQNDPLNIHQTIIKDLKDVRREPIANVEDLCRVITSACLNAFDHHNTPDEYHFFDFIEHAIGQVVGHDLYGIRKKIVINKTKMDRTAERFQEFGLLLNASTASNKLLSALNIRIEEETKLLAEIEDIRDELGILKLVLSDQQSVTEELETLLGPAEPQEDPDDDSESTVNTHTLKENRVLLSHLARVARMEVAADRSIESVCLRLIMATQLANHPDPIAFDIETTTC